MQKRASTVQLTARRDHLLRVIHNLTRIREDLLTLRDSSERSGLLNSNERSLVIMRSSLAGVERDLARP